MKCLKRKPYDTHQITILKRPDNAKNNNLLRIYYHQEEKTPPLLPQNTFL